MSLLNIQRNRVKYVTNKLVDASQLNFHAVGFRYCKDCRYGPYAAIVVFFTMLQNVVGFTRVVNLRLDKLGRAVPARKLKWTGPGRSDPNLSWAVQAA